MELFAVHLTFMLKVDAPDPDEPVRELAINLVFASNEDEAREKGARIGRERETEYLNIYGQTVRNTFQGMVEVQHLFEKNFRDGMEVSCWRYRGDRLVIEESWTDPHGVESKPKVPDEAAGAGPVSRD